MKNILTVDVEELHHRLAYSDECKKKGLTFHGSALLGTIKIIKLLKRYRQTATFFIIGEILEKYPDIGNLIIQNGHEIANHTYKHTELNNFDNIDDFAESIDKTDTLIHNICNVKSIGFRAPKWNLPDNIKDYIAILKNRGYKYDSSLFPANGYGYGTKNSLPYCYKMSKSNFFLEDISNDFFEIPTSVYCGNGFRLPIKLRHFGSRIQKKVIERMNKAGYPAVLTLHTWEIINIPSSFLKLGGMTKNFIRNYNIPFDKTLEKILKDYCFESIINNISDSGLSHVKN